MMRNKYLLILEIVWITTGLLSAGAAIRTAITTGGRMVFIFASMSLVCFVFAWLRHSQRKKS